MSGEAIGDTIDAAGEEGRPFAELRPTGLLWLINVTVFHPRGYALAIHLNDEGEATGWSLMGDGTESWTMGDPPEDQRPAGYQTCDDLFAAAKALLA